MTTKFNQEMYARIKGKKNEPLSSLGQRRLRVTDKEKEKETVERGLSTPTLDEGRATSPGVSIKKIGSSVWVDAEAFEQFATLYIYAFTFIHLVLMLHLACIFCLLWVYLSSIEGLGKFLLRYPLSSI